jgi:hypothetical protein
MMEQHANDLVTPEMLAAEGVAEIVDDLLRITDNPADMSWAIGRMEEAVETALYFCGRLPKSTAQNAISSRLLFLKSELKVWFERILRQPAASQAQKEGK